MGGCIPDQNHDGPRSKPSSLGWPFSPAVRIRPPGRVPRREQHEADAGAVKQAPPGF